MRLENLEQVDIYDVEPPQTGIDRTLNVRGGRGCGCVAHRLAELRCDDCLMPPAAQRATEVFLARSGRVPVGRIEEIDPRVERGVHHALRLRCIEARPEVVAPQTDDGHRERSDVACLHPLLLGWATIRIVADLEVDRPALRRLVRL